MKKIATFHKGRKCKHPRCKHILSIYNGEIYCRQHSSQAWREQSSRSRPA